MIHVPLSDLSAEYRNLKAEIDAAIKRVIESGNFVMGPELAAFEKEVAAYLGVAYVVGVGSGTAALHLGMLAAGIKPEDEIITVPNTDLPTTAAITHCGARFVWVDVDPRTFNIDPARIEAAITKRTRAILPVHLHGNPADMGPIVDIARRHDLLIIEDASLAFGAEYHGKKAGTFGAVGCFSLAVTKILGAYGDAGFVATGNREIADQIRVLRDYGHSIAMYDTTQDGIAGFSVWEMAAEGFNERLDTLQAAIVRAKLPTVDQRIARRREVAATYAERLADLNLVPAYQAPNTKHVYRGYPVLVADRDRVQTELRARGIRSSAYYLPPLHEQPVYRHLGYKQGHFPVTDDLSDRTLGLPVFPEITAAQVDHVVEVLRACVPAR